MWIIIAVSHVKHLFSRVWVPSKLDMLMENESALVIVNDLTEISKFPKFDLFLTC
jgi:hypothetical protein